MLEFGFLFFFEGGELFVCWGFLFVCLYLLSVCKLKKKHMTGGILGTLLRANELYKEGLIITATALKWT